MAASSSTAARERLDSIQYLRALAALAVIFHHARNPRPWLFDGLSSVTIGQAGVDVFFVISGFIMYVAARHQRPAEFVRRRITRIVPLYWIATLLFVILTLQRAPIDWWRLAQSLLFIPHFDPNNPGLIFPLLIPGWSLNYEMFFYALFAIGLLTRRTVAWLVVAILVLVAAGRAEQFNNAIWISYTNLLLLEFMAGVLLAKYRDHLKNAIIPWLLPLGIVCILLSDLVALPRVLEWGAPSVAIVAGAVAMERTKKLPRWKILLLTGDASYAMYLFHPFVCGGVAVALSAVPISGPPQLALMLAASMILSTIAGIAIHTRLEKPILQRSRLKKNADLMAAP